MTGVTGVGANAHLSAVDVDYDDEVITIAEMKTELDSQHFYLGYVNLTASQAKNIMDTQAAVVVVDVREKSEYCDGHISGSILSPWTSEVFQREYDTILPQQGSIILVCRSGNRSDQAARFLYDYNFSKGRDMIVYNIQDGMNEWSYATEVCHVSIPGETPRAQPWLNYLLRDRESVSDR